MGEGGHTSGASFFFPLAFQSSAAGITSPDTFPSPAYHNNAGTIKTQFSGDFDGAVFGAKPTFNCASWKCLLSNPGTVWESSSVTPSHQDYKVKHFIFGVHLSSSER